MGHLEEGIEGSEAVTEARAEEPGGGGTAVEARHGALGSDGTAVKASTWTGIGGRTQIAQKERNRKGFALRQELLQRKRALEASQQHRRTRGGALTPPLSGEGDIRGRCGPRQIFGTPRSSRAPPPVGAAGAHGGARLAALPVGTAIVAALRQLSLATAAQSAAIAALLAAFLGGSRAPLAGSAGPPGPTESRSTGPPGPTELQSGLLSALHAANDDTFVSGAVAFAARP